MTPDQFIDKWARSQLKERSAAQEHFIDLCRLLGEPTPAEADPEGTFYTFEKGVKKTTGGDGWADVWKRGHFAWEYKGRHANLEEAYVQLARYAPALEYPPLLVTCDTSRFVVRTAWTNTVQATHEFSLPDLQDFGVRQLLKNVFSNPEALKPGKTRQELTEEAAEAFANLAKRLRERGHDPQAVAHFVNRLVFCMFAEDVQLLPERIFEKLLDTAYDRPSLFEGMTRDLFNAMSTGGRVFITAIDWFNGGLFDDDTTLSLNKEDIREVQRAARLDWSNIDPSILGTLFERGLDPDKRSQLGAHYTDRDKIMLIINPVIVDPLLADWEATKAAITADFAARTDAVAEKARLQAEAAEAFAASGAKVGEKSRRDRIKALEKAAAAAIEAAEARHVAFLERLAAFRVLDPACGSGNFLYLALRALKDIEHRANVEAEALGLPRRTPRVGPEAVKGIEINPYAAELARVSVWIGEIQWMRANGFEAARNPILRPLDTIECRDAILNPNGTRADWPAADVVVGNPPFLGNKKMIGDLGEEYTTKLRNAWDTVPRGADLVTYWFAKAWEEVEAGRIQRAGLVATNSIRGGANRKVLEPIVERGRIFNAWSDEEWTVEGAAVRVSIVCFSMTAESVSKNERIDSDTNFFRFNNIRSRKCGLFVRK